MSNVSDCPIIVDHTDEHVIISDWSHIGKQEPIKEITTEDKPKISKVKGKLRFNADTSYKYCLDVVIHHHDSVEMCIKLLIVLALWHNAWQYDTDRYKIQKLQHKIEKQYLQLKSKSQILKNVFLLSVTNTLNNAVQNMASMKDINMWDGLDTIKHTLLSTLARFEVLYKGLLPSVHDQCVKIQRMFEVLEKQQKVNARHLCETKAKLQSSHEHNLKCMYENVETITRKKLLYNCDKTDSKEKRNILHDKIDLKTHLADHLMNEHKLKGKAANKVWIAKQTECTHAFLVNFSEVYRAATATIKETQKTLQQLNNELRSTILRLCPMTSKQVLKYKELLSAHVDMVENCASEIDKVKTVFHDCIQQMIFAYAQQLIT